MAQSMDRVRTVSEPNSPDYDPNSPHYDVTVDPSSKFFVGPPTGDHKSGDEIRAEVTNAVDQAIGPPGGFLDMVLGPVKNQIIERVYQNQLEVARRGLGDNMALRALGDPPRTLWENASHEQMVEVINSNADSSAVAVTSEEWVRLGNDLADQQKAFGRAINDSLGNWEGDAGDAARTHLAEVAKWLGGTADGAVLTGRQQEIHSQALNETQKAMAGNPPVPFSAEEANGRLAQITDPVAYAMQFSAEMDTSARHHAARDRAAEVMVRYDETVGSAATTPKFSAPPTLRGTTRMDSTSAAPTASPRNDAGAAPIGDGVVRNDMSAASMQAGNGTVPNGGVPAGTVPIGNGTVPNAGMPAGSGVPGGAFSGGGLPGGGQPVPSMLSAPDFTSSATGANSSTGPSGVMPPGSIPTPNVPDGYRVPTVPSGSPGGAGAGYPLPNFASPSGQDGGRTTRFPAAQQNMSTGPNVPDVPGRGFGPGGVPPVSGGTPGGGVPGGGRFGGPGPVPGMAAGGQSPGGAVGATPGGAPGGRGGFGPMGGGGPLGVTGARGPGAAGMPMAGGMGGAGAGDKGEDKEYRVASYLKGDEEILAPGKVVSPPVIGDWNNEQDWK